MGKTKKKSSQKWYSGVERKSFKKYPSLGKKIPKENKMKNPEVKKGVAKKNS